MGNVYVRAGLTLATVVAIWLNVLAYDEHVHSLDYYWMTYAGLALAAVGILAAIVLLFGLVRLVIGTEREPDQ